MTSGAKKLLTLLAACIFALGFCSCAEEVPPAAPGQQTAEPEAAPTVERGQNPDAIRIGVSMQGWQKPYVRRVRDCILAEGEKLAGQVEITMLNGDEDAEKQNAQIEKFISQKMDVIIFNPTSYEDCELGVELASESGVPLVFVITTTKNAEKAQAYAISDHKVSALIQMDMVAEYLHGEGNIVMLRGIKGIESEIARTEGYYEKLEEYSDINLLDIQTAGWTREDAYAIVENWIRLGMDIDAIVSQNDNMAIGALQAVEEAGKEGEIAVFGIDGDKDALQLVKQGKLTGTVNHDAQGQAEKAVEYAVKLARGETVESEFVPFERVDGTNVDEFIRRQANEPQNAEDL